jgi:PAS domain S-box-containing protein
MNKMLKSTEEAPQKVREELEIRVAEKTAELARSNERLMKEIEERKAAEELYKALTNSSYTGIYILQEGRFQFLNPRAAECFGYSPDELMGIDSKSIIHPQDRNIARKNAIEMLRGERKIPYEFRVVTKDKKIRWIMESIMPIHYKGTPALLGNSTDFTEYKEAMKKVEEHESIETSILEAIPHPVVGLHNRCVIFANNAVKSVFGWRPEELIGKNTRILYRNQEEYEEIGEVVYNALKSQRTWSSEFYCRHMNGHDIICRMNASGIDSDLNERRVVVVYEDITEKKQAENEKKILEAQLGQAQKMEAIGTLAGGIAHDFNNILGAVLGNIELALLEIKKDSHLRRYLERTLKAIERAVDLVRQILTFSRQGEHERRPLIINPVIKEAMKLLRATLPAKIEIRQNVSYDKYIVIVDPTQIHQVIMNLCTNAAHAMRETGGILEISLSHIDISLEVPLYLPKLPPGPYLELVVRDSGHGVEPDIMDKIFDPFFTTKGAGEGTGMGLAVVYGIVKSCGGEIRVESEPGNGTAFFVYLPIVIDKNVSSEEEHRVSIPRGQERILFVDDEEDIAQLTEDILSRLGYKVITEVSSLVALRVFRAKPDLFDLVITDMNMPNMTGIELAQDMLKVRPDIPIILCTGFSESVTPEKIKSLGIRELIMKPIVMRQLAETIRQVLDR